MISKTDAPQTYELDKYYIIVPNHYDFDKSILKKHINNKVDINFNYDSSKNKHFLVEEIKLIIDNIDNSFMPFLKLMEEEYKGKFIPYGKPLKKI